jgi:Rps23 Pro-64 3,4-dihydroxylase Tpa1-like proline 4-hydroxylase
MAAQDTMVMRSLGGGYGVEVRLDDRTTLELADFVRAALPPELTAGDGAAEEVVTYTVTATGEPPEYVVAADGLEVFAAESVESVGDWLAQDVDATVASRSREMTFVHAGVVGWRGLAIAIPGPRSPMISTLVAELVRRGAVYYSDRFAVLDGQGRVHPYRAPLEIDGKLQRDLRLVQDDVAAEPLPLGLVLACGGPPAAVWRPRVGRGRRSALPLVEAAVGPRDDDRLADLVAILEPTLVTLRGPWPDPVGAAAHLLDLVDEAYVSYAVHALTDEADGAAGLTDHLVRAAETRLHSEPPRPVTPFRRLIATPHVKVSDFLSSADRSRLLDHALRWEEEFTESGIVGNAGENKLDHEARKSRTLRAERFEEVWDLIEGPLRALLPYARRELGIEWFPLGKLERQLTAHGAAGFFMPHVDTGHPLVASRRISCVYYFHPTPRRYRGGELRLYDTWDTPTGTTGAASWTTVTPEDNSLVLFPSDTFHEVRPVQPESDAFADSRFAVTMWVHEGEWPESTPTAQVRP